MSEYIRLYLPDLFKIQKNPKSKISKISVILRKTKFAAIFAHISPIF